MNKGIFFGMPAALVMAGSLVLSGCGGGSSGGGGGSDDPGVTDTTVTGNAVDGYLRYSTVCLDLDKDGYCQFDSEPYGQTGTDGSYGLTVTTTHKDHANYDTAKLIVFGGQDSDTGKDFNYKLMAPYDGETSAHITPLTTMIAAYMEENSASVSDAKTKVAAALGLEEDDVTADPVKMAETKPALLNAALQVQKAVEVIATATTGNDSGEKATEAFKALVSGVATATTAADVKTGVQALVTAAKSSSKVDQNKADAIEAAAKAVSDIVDASIGSGDSIDSETLQKAVLVIDDAKEAIETKASSGDTTGYDTVTTDAATAMASETSWQEMLVQSFLDQLDSSADAAAIATNLGAAVTAGMTWEAFETALTTEGGYTDIVSLIKKRIIKGYLAGKTFYVAHPEWSDFSPGAVAFNADASSAIGQDDENTFTSSVTLTETGFVMSGDHGGTFSGFVKSSDGTYFTATYTNINGTEYLDVRLYLSQTAAIAYQEYEESASSSSGDSFDFNEIVGATVYEVTGDDGTINAFIFGSDGSILTDAGDPSVTPTVDFGTYTISSDGSSLTLNGNEHGETFTDILTFDSFINEYCMTVMWGDSPNVFCGEYQAAVSYANGESTTTDGDTSGFPFAGVVFYMVDEGGTIYTMKFDTRGVVKSSEGVIAESALETTAYTWAEKSDTAISFTGTSETYDVSIGTSWDASGCNSVMWGDGPTTICMTAESAQAEIGSTTDSPVSSTETLESKLMQNSWYPVVVEPGGAACQGKETYTSTTEFRVDYIENGTAGVYNGSYAVNEDIYIIYDGDTEYPEEYRETDADGNLVMYAYTEDTHEKVDKKLFKNRADAIAYGEANGNANCADYFPAD